MKNEDTSNYGKILFVPLVIFADQLTKLLASRYVPVRESAGFFSIWLTAALLAAFIFLCWRYVPSAARTAAFYLIVGGALSNIIDRLDDGFVVDFINAGISTMNFADVAIIIGIGLLTLKS